jgi:STAM-binding protein
MQQNTRSNIETCALLGGRLENDNNISVISLVVPKQTGDANKVEMLNEEEYLFYMLEKDLLCLGWIHSHPQQTCFLSSIDVHTQLGYQVRASAVLAFDGSDSTSHRVHLYFECRHVRLHRLLLWIGLHAG